MDCSTAEESLQKAYEMTRAHLRETLQPDEGLNGCGSIEDFHSVLLHAKTKYESKPKSKANIWLTRFSQRVHQYGVVLDVLVQHHPEYVSLVWGMFKLIFGAVVDHENQLKQLAKACTQISDLLPRAKITSELYQTHAVSRAVTSLYTSIIVFLRHAVDWYKQGKVNHAWTAIARPWELGFRDYVEDINVSSRRLEQLATISSQVELRDTHLETTRIREEIRQVRAQLDMLLKDTSQNHSLMTGSRAAIGRIELNQILSSPLLSRLPTSGESLNYCCTLRNRRRRKLKLPSPSIGQLQHWSRADGATFVFMQCNRAQTSKDFLVNLIELIQEAKLPAIWAMRFENYWDKQLNYRDLLKMLVVHSLQVNPDALTTRAFPITEGSLREAVDEKDWLAILSRALSGMPVIYVVLDAEVLGHAMEHNTNAITKMLELVPRTVATKLKIIVAESAIDDSYVRRNWSISDWVRVDVDNIGRKREANSCSFVAQRTLKRRRRR